MISQILIIFISIPLLINACTEVKVCLHSGSFNNKTCTCDCFPSYKGESCEFSNCNNEPSVCRTDFKPALCSESSISNYCPLMCNQSICKCGFDSCLNGGFFLASSCSCICPVQYVGSRCESLLTTTTTLKPCLTQLSCLNGAKQNPKTCKCECYPAYTGNNCETLVCENEPPQCKDVKTSDCNCGITSLYCPVLCGKCVTQTSSASTITTTTTITTTRINSTSITTTPTTTTQQSCSVKICNYGFSFDVKSCKCNCGPGFYGDLCTFNCSSNINQIDDEICEELSCDSDTVIKLCPLKCLCLKESSCLPCYNNGKLNRKTCECTCPPEFNGERCQYALDPCEIDDLPEYCSQYSCWESTSSYFFKCQRKCLCCGNKECKNLGRLVTKGSNKCSCACANDSFDPETDCSKPTENCKDQFSNCLAQFTVNSCNDPFVLSLCPKMCGLCD